jgi:hypothetical protein
VAESPGRYALIVTIDRAVNFLDLSGIENYLSALADYLATSHDFALGVTTTTPQLPSMMKIAAEIRARRPDLRLMLGGPHVILVYYEDALGEVGFNRNYRLKRRENLSTKLSKSSGVSSTATIWCAVRPCCRAVIRAVARPSGVLGPMLSYASRRLASIAIGWSWCLSPVAVRRRPN